ncbi:hypothetical protein Pan181_05380 [Aeoliella mucimassa]|uniref:PEP-CTERM protein-sorting domain-containing protein n=1 Tax=Aeoliella mucimassa TaxID=2527972 RepID=A0A518AI04_9BACT|nr:hypothetical protein Pan181_05380 [Aeoliella mucimassa]
MHTFLRVLSLAFVVNFSGHLHGAVFDLPEVTVSSMAATSGPSFVLPVDLEPADSFRALVSGTVDFDSDNGANYSADWNAAGVVVRTRSTRLTVGGSDPQFVDIGWLRLSLGNDSLGYFPLLEVDEQNGFGSAAPPESLVLNRELGDIFDISGFSGLPAGTTLQFRIYDSPTSDNSGSFKISQIPEPSTASMVIVGAIVFAMMRRLYVSERYSRECS